MLLNVSRNHQLDYTFDFSDFQLLKSLRSKLRRAYMTVAAQSDLIKTPSSFRKISQWIGSSYQFFNPSQSEIHLKLQHLIDHVNRHKQRPSIRLSCLQSTTHIVRENGNLLDQQSTGFLIIYPTALQDTRLVTTVTTKLSITMSPL